MQENWLFSTKRGKRLLFGVLFAIILVLLAILLVLIGANDKPANEEEQYSPEIDPISGEMVWNIDEEPEIGEELILLGFYDLRSLGFMSSQYEKVMDNIKSYIADNYPDCERASYKEDSFKYLDENWFVSSFEFVLDSGERFLVRLDTGGSLSEISVGISKEE